MHSREEGAHETPARIYLLVWAALIVLTGVTVGVTCLHLGKWAKFTAMLVATVKASLVALYFMHLRHERRLVPIILVVTLATFGVFLILTFTDYSFR